MNVEVYRYMVVLAITFRTFIYKIILGEHFFKISIVYLLEDGRERGGGNGGEQRRTGRGGEEGEGKEWE